MRNLLRVSGGIPGIRAPGAAEARAGLYRAEALFARGVRECEATRPVPGRPAGGQRATAEGAHGAGSGAGRAAAGAGEKRLAQVGESHRSDLNRRPLDYESRALPLSYGG